jgi:V8-like Glu-specific endopeptidase
MGALEAPPGAGAWGATPLNGARNCATSRRKSVGALLCPLQRPSNAGGPALGSIDARDARRAAAQGSRDTGIKQFGDNNKRKGEIEMSRRKGVAVTLLLLLAPVAVAQNRIVKQTISLQESAAAADYWTPERRASASPRDIVLPLAAERAPQPPAAPEPFRAVPGMLPELNTADTPPAGEARYWTPENAERSASPAGMEALGGAALGAPAPELQPPYPYPYVRYTILSKVRNDYPYKTVGKLFFTLNGINYVCSASVIRPHLLLTARHCIYSNGNFATNVVFYPGYWSGPNNTLGGAWYARAMITWVSNLLEFDIGFIQTYNQNRTGCRPTSTNRQIESFTGYLGYAWGGDYTRKHFDVLAYPHAWPFTGGQNVQCEASAGDINVRGISNTLEIGCDMTGGSSGGPWLHTFAPGVSGLTNLARSLVSYKWSDRPEAINGPIFLSHNFNLLLTAALAMPCP